MRPELPDLAGLIAATARRDAGAFRDLYRLTAPKLMGVALRIVRDRGIAEDVVQDAYVKIWHAAASFNLEAGRPMTWLIAIARHRAIDLVRQRREVLLSPDQDGADPIENVAAFGDGEADLVLRDQLRLCLDQIGEPQRECLLAAYRDGFSREELSRRYDRPVNTIKTWLHRSAAALRLCLDAP